MLTRGAVFSNPIHSRYAYIDPPMAPPQLIGSPMAVPWVVSGNWFLGPCLYDRHQSTELSCGTEHPPGPRRVQDCFETFVARTVQLVPLIRRRSNAWWRARSMARKLRYGSEYSTTPAPLPYVPTLGWFGLACRHIWSVWGMM